MSNTGSQTNHSTPKDATKELVAAVSHRINNLMQHICGSEFLIDAGLEAEDFKRIAEEWSTVKRTQNRISKLSVNLNIFCLDFKPHPRKLALHDLIQVATSEIGDSFAGTRLKIAHQTAADATVELDDFYSCRAIENLLCVGLMASDSGDGDQQDVILETLAVEGDVLIRVRFRHFDDRFDLMQLLDPEGEFNKVKGDQGLLELIVSRKIVEQQNGTIKGVCEAGNLNSIEVRFPSQI